MFFGLSLFLIADLLREIQAMCLFYGVGGGAVHPKQPTKEGWLTGSQMVYVFDLVTQSARDLSSQVVCINVVSSSVKRVITSPQIVYFGELLEA